MRSRHLMFPSAGLKKCLSTRLLYVLYVPFLFGVPIGHEAEKENINWPVQSECEL